METHEDRYQRFVDFLERHRPFIWKLCNRYADGDPTVGLDYVQDISILLWLRQDKLRLHATPRQERYWISLIARDYLRSQRKKIPVEPLDIDNLPVSAYTVDDTPSDLLHEYMVCLPPSEHQAVELYVQGYKAKEIALILGIGAVAVRQRLRRAVAHMREYAKKIDNPNP